MLRVEKKQFYLKKKNYTQMFLIESFRDYRSTEPVWFRFFRGFFAVALTALLIGYSITKFKKLSSIDDSPDITYTLKTNGKKKNYIL